MPRSLVPKPAPPREPKQLALPPLPARVAGPGQLTQVIDANRQLNADMMSSMVRQELDRQRFHKEELEKDRQRLTTLFGGAEPSRSGEFNQRLNRTEESNARREELDKERARGVKGRGMRGIERGMKERLNAMKERQYGMHRPTIRRHLSSRCWRCCAGIICSLIITLDILGVMAGHSRTTLPFANRTGT
jgi:hypothetical protein